MIPENWPTLLVPGLRKIFHSRMRAREELFKRTEVFNVDTSQRAYEDYQGIGELGPDMFNEFEKAGSVTYDQFDPGFLTRLEHREYAGGYIVKQKLLEDNQYPEAGIPRKVTQRVEKLGSAAAIHRERSAAALFNNAFTDSGVDAEGHPVAGADAVGLCSTAHPVAPGSGTTQSNEYTLALTPANLTTVKLGQRGLTDDKGQLIAMHPDRLLVPPELSETAWVINNSELDPLSANNAKNPHKGRWNIIEWDYLTDANAWFMIDSVLRDEHLVWLDRTLPEFTSEGVIDTRSAKYVAYHRFSRGWDAWQWVAGSNPS